MAAEEGSLKFYSHLPIPPPISAKERFNAEVSNLMNKLNLADIDGVISSIDILASLGIDMNTKVFITDVGSGIRIIGTLFFALAVAEYSNASCPESDIMTNRRTITKEEYSLLAQKLIESGCYDNESTDDFFEQTPLMAAIGFGNTQAALAFIEICSESVINYVSRHPVYASSALVLSIQRGQDIVVRELIRAGADVELPISISQKDINSELRIPEKYNTLPLQRISRTSELTVSPLQWAFIFAASVSIINELVEKSDEYKMLLRNPGIKSHNSPYLYLYINPSHCYPLTICGLMHASILMQPEFFPILSHYWDNLELFFRHRAPRIAAIVNAFVIPNLLSRAWRPETLRYLNISLGLCSLRGSLTWPVSSMRLPRGQQLDNDIYLYICDGKVCSIGCDITDIPSHTIHQIESTIAELERIRVEKYSHASLNPRSIISSPDTLEIGDIVEEALEARREESVEIDSVPQPIAEDNLTAVAEKVDTHSNPRAYSSSSEPYKTYDFSYRIFLTRRHSIIDDPLAVDPMRLLYRMSYVI